MPRWRGREGSRRLRKIFSINMNIFEDRRRSFPIWRDIDTTRAWLPARNTWMTLIAIWPAPQASLTRGRENSQDPLIGQHISVDSADIILLETVPENFALAARKLLEQVESSLPDQLKCAPIPGRIRFADNLPAPSGAHLDGHGQAALIPAEWSMVFCDSYVRQAAKKAAEEKRPIVERRPPGSRGAARGSSLAVALGRGPHRTRPTVGVPELVWFPFSHPCGAMCGQEAVSAPRLLIPTRPRSSGGRPEERDRRPAGNFLKLLRVEFSQWPRSSGG